MKSAEEGCQLFKVDNPLPYLPDQHLPVGIQAQQDKEQDTE
jgi:hypothetical protein